MPGFLLAALLVGYIPGALFYRLPGCSQPMRAGLAAEERLFWAVVLSAVWSTGIVLALAALELYSFPWLLTINAGVSLAILAAGRRRLRLGRAAPRPTWTMAVPAGIVVLGSWMYFPASEYIIGGRDPGVYVNEGVQIAQRGALVVTDPVIASVPAVFRDLFFPSHNNPDYYGLRFVGYYVQDPATGAVVGQFPHLFPASIALGYGLNGLSGARQAGPVWAMLGLLAVYFTGAHLFGRLAAAAATGLLAIHVVEVWFARYPTSEVVMQTLLFAAVLALTYALQARQVFFAAVAGLLAGGLLFLRYDAVLAVGALAGAATIAAAAGQRPGPAFWAALASSSALGAWYLAGPMRAYLALPLDATRRIGGFWIVPACVALAWIVPRLLRRERLAAAVRRTLPPAAAVVLVALAIYAYFFRDQGGRLAVEDARAFYTFGQFYLTPWVLGAAVAGMAWFVSTRFWRAPAFFVTLGVFSLFFFYKTRIVHEHFWTARRFVPMILPGALLVATAFVYELSGPTRVRTVIGGGRVGSALPRIVGAAACAAVLALVSVTYWRASDPVRHHVEYAGLIPKLEELAGRLGDRDLVIVESRNAGSDLHTLATPLAYIYARQVLVLDSPVPSKRRFEAFVEWARTTYDRIWFLGGGGTDLLTATVTAEPIVSEHFQVAEYDAPYDSYPDGVRRKEFEYGLYRLLPAAPRHDGPVGLDIGIRDDLNVVRFHAKERHEDGETFRWSGPLSYVLLQGIGPDARAVTIWMSDGGRPPHAAVPEVEVTLEGRVLGRAIPGDGLQAYAFAIPPDLASAIGTSADPARLELRVQTWNPSALLGVNDTRDLGVLVSRVDVQ